MSARGIDYSGVINLAGLIDGLLFALQIECLRSFCNRPQVTEFLWGHIFSTSANANFSDNFDWWSSSVRPDPLSWSKALLKKEMRKWTSFPITLSKNKSKVLKRLARETRELSWRWKDILPSNFADEDIFPLMVLLSGLESLPEAAFEALESLAGLFEDGRRLEEELLLDEGFFFAAAAFCLASFFLVVSISSPLVVVVMVTPPRAVFFTSNWKIKWHVALRTKTTSLYHLLVPHLDFLAVY